ncbi:hypothetical protein PPACK8108_LOCUS22045 [Phakopsora pachyrhizi]|uniref:Uncharacterized protein n=1 Tax=Phakopsora pachyrhizi TaxID=170000 RepID=A0AAV0BMD4_PHAPC|nr:hypothetical protein PPACK8108_LOCUS22045 [Phakopsora pachyrhizi]
MKYQTNSTTTQVELGHPENLNIQSTSVSSSSLHYSNSFYGGKLMKNFNLGKKIQDWWSNFRSSFTVTLDNKIGPLVGSLGSSQHRWNLISPGPLSAGLRSCSFCCLSSNKFPSLDESPAPDDGKSIKPLKIQGEGNEKNLSRVRVATNTLLLIETMFPVKYWHHSGEFLASKSQLAMELNASENSITRLLLVGTGATLVSLNLYHAKISSLGQEFFDALVSCEATHLSEKLIDEGQSVVDKPSSIKWKTSETTYLGSS